MTTELTSAARQSASVKIVAYQRRERPLGGKTRLCCALSETPAMIATGAARNKPTRAKNSRFMRPPLRASTRTGQ